MNNKRLMPSLMLTAFLILIMTGNAFAAQEMLKTSKVKVGEKMLFTETLKKAHDKGNAIVLVLFPNPLGCKGCDELISLLGKEAERNKDIAYIMAGAQDILGAPGSETAELKRLYGFVTMGAPWTFFIDKEGILRKILLGPFGREELDVLNAIIGGKK